MAKTYTVDFTDRYEKADIMSMFHTLKGVHKIVITKPRKYVTRYRYYWAHLIKSLEAEHIFKSANGELMDSKGIHETLKKMFNPTLIEQKDGLILETGETTTALEDKDFIDFYEQSIIAFFSSDPYNIDFEDRSSWIDRQKIKYHNNQKILNQIR